VIEAAGIQVLSPSKALALQLSPMEVNIAFFAVKGALSERGKYPVGPFHCPDFFEPSKLCTELVVSLT
jgi:hypothetical protein